MWHVWMQMGIIAPLALLGIATEIVVIVTLFVRRSCTESPNTET
jgi:hypothetical protein